MVGKITSDKKLSASRIAVAMDEHPSQEPNEVFNDVCEAIAGIPKAEITDVRSVSYTHLTLPTKA